MKINIRGNGVTPEQVAEILRTCEEKYGLKTKNVTLYVRYTDENGEDVEPTLSHGALTEDFTFSRSAIKREPAPISIEDMKSELEKAKKKPLTRVELQSVATLFEMKIDRATFLKALYKTIEVRPNFNMRYFERVAFVMMER